MPFTTSLNISFTSPRLVPADASPVEARAWRVSTTVDGEGNAYDHQNTIEIVPVPVSLGGGILSSRNLTFSRDLSEPFEATRADFAVVAIQVLPEPGFLFRSAKLKANPAPTSGGTIGLNIVRGQRDESLEALQNVVSKLVPRQLSGLPPGFTGTASSITVSSRPGFIDLKITGSVAPPRPPAPHRLPSPCPVARQLHAHDVFGG